MTLNGFLTSDPATHSLAMDNQYLHYCCISRLCSNATIGDFVGVYSHML